MPTIAKKPEFGNKGLTFVGLDQSFRINCKDRQFRDGATGDINLLKPGFLSIDMVLIAQELVHGPVPPVNLDKLRLGDGPLKYQFAQRQADATKSTNQELIQVLVDSAFKNRGIVYGFILPSSYDNFSEEGQKAINPNMLTTTNFHEVSLTRQNGGFCKYLLDLQNAGLAPWEVITTVTIADSHTNSNTGDMLAGVFFEYREPNTKEEKAFLKQVKEAVYAEGDEFEIPRPRILSQCVAYENVAAFLLERESMPRFIGSVLVDRLLVGRDDYKDVAIQDLRFNSGSEFALTSTDEIEAQAQRLLGPVGVAPVVDLGTDDEVTTLEAQAA